jgi:hypothetical protein
MFGRLTGNENSTTNGVMGTACSSHSVTGKVLKILIRKPSRKEQNDISAASWMIKEILKTVDIRMWNGLMWARVLMAGSFGRCK